MSLSTEKITDQQTRKSCGFQEDLEYLRQTPLLRGVDLECLKLLAMLCRRLTLVPGDQIMIQGEDDGNAFLVLSGQLSGLHIKDEQSRVVCHFGPGQFVGGCALLGRLPRLFTLQAAEKTTTLQLNREEFTKALQQFPGTLAKITGNLISELAEWDRNLLDTDNFEEDAGFRTLGVSLI